MWVNVIPKTALLTASFLVDVWSGLGFPGGGGVIKWRQIVSKASTSLREGFSSMVSLTWRLLLSVVQFCCCAGPFFCLASVCFSNKELWLLFPTSDRTLYCILLLLCFEFPPGWGTLCFSVFVALKWAVIWWFSRIFFPKIYQTSKGSSIGPELQTVPLSLCWITTLPFEDRWHERNELYIFRLKTLPRHGRRSHTASPVCHAVLSAIPKTRLYSNKKEVRRDNYIGYLSSLFRQGEKWDHPGG